MTLYTSYFANLKNIPDSIVPISIALYPPKGYTGLSYPPLFPTPDILKQVKSSGDHRTYILNYKHQVLDHLDMEHVLHDLSILSNDQDTVLLCYEKPTKGFYCHRQLVSKWFGEHGITISEITSDNLQPSDEQSLF